VKLKVVINPKQIEPAQEHVQCELCTLNVAMLKFHAFDQKGEEILSSHYVCSLCFLYESPWGKRRAAEVRETINDIERGSDERWLRSTTGDIALCSDANKVVFAIASSSEMLFAMQRGELSPQEVHAMSLDPASEEVTPASLLSPKHRDPFQVNNPRKDSLIFANPPLPASQPLTIRPSFESPLILPSDDFKKS